MNLLAFVIASLSLTGCIQGPGLFQQSGAGSSAEITSTEKDGVVSGAFKAGSSTTQTMLATGTISGSSVKFPPGALAVDTEITLEEGASIAGGGAAAQLGISGGMSAAGPSVVITSSVKLNANNAFTLQIPLTSSKLALGNDPSLLIVIYKIQDAKTGDYMIGIIPNSDIKIVSGNIQFDTKYFGSFQAAYTEQKVEKAVEVKTDTPILTAAEYKKLEDIRWIIKTPVSDNATRKVTFAAAASGFSKINYCMTMIYETNGTFVDSKKVGDAAAIEFSYKANDNAHSFVANFSCEDNKGRYEESKNSDKVTFEAANSAPVSISISPATSTTTLGGAVTFSAIGTFADGSTKDISSKVNWSSSDFTISGSIGGGVVTSLSIGVAKIRATLGALTAEGQLAVQAGAIGTSIPNTKVPMPVANPTGIPSATDDGFLFATNDHKLWYTHGEPSDVKLLKTFDNYFMLDSAATLTTPAGQKLTIFKGTDTDHGDEPWVTDGTAVGTHMLADLNSSQSGSSPYNFIENDGKVYFIAGGELWRTDGTNTDQITSLSGASIYNVFSFREMVYFVIYDNVTYNYKLFVTDGDPGNGTEVLYNSASIATLSYGFTQANSKLYFLGEQGGYAYIWKINASGTVTQVKQITSMANVTNLKAIGDELYFSYTNASDSEPWVSDGTSAGTLALGDLNPAGSSNPAYFSGVNSKVYFQAFDSDHYPLWVYDPSNSYVGVVTGTGCSTYADAYNITAFGNLVVFTSTTATAGNELVVYDGTTCTAFDLEPESGVGSNPSSFTIANNKMFFYATIGGVTKPFIFDGSASGPVLLQDLISNGLKTATIGTSTYYWDTTSTANSGLYKQTDSAAPARIFDTSSFSNKYPSRDFIRAGDMLYFVVQENSYDSLYQTDGTTNTPIVNSSTNNHLSYIQGLTPMPDGKLYFSANDSTHADKRLLHIWDPGSGLTELNSTLLIANNDNGLNSYAAIDSTFFFSAETATYPGAEFWKWDTASSTPTRIADLNPGSGASWPNNIKKIGASIYYIGNDGSDNNLCKYDGSHTCIPLLSPISSISDYYVIGANVFIRWYSTFYKITNPFSASAMVSTLSIGSGVSLSASGSDQFYMFDVDGSAYFYYVGNSSGPSMLYKFSGNEYVYATDAVGNTCKVDATNLDPSVTGGKLYISCKSAAYGSELWVFASTGVTVIDLMPGPTSSSPTFVNSLGESSGKVFFVADSPLYGREMFVTTGSLETTAIIKDVASGVADSSPIPMAFDAGTLLFYADDLSGFGHRLLKIYLGQ